MYLKKLKIRNFRCFKNYEVEFAPHVTVLFGKNGTGKTTLIHAIHKALSFLMYSERIKDRNEKTGRKEVVDKHTIVKGNPYLRPEGFAKQGDLNNTIDPFIEIEAVASLSLSENNYDLQIGWKMSAYSDKLRLREGEFIDAFRKFYDWHRRTNNLPVLAYLSDSFPHKEDTHHIRLKKKISDYRNFGYYNWNSDFGNTQEWVDRLERALREVDRIERKVKTMRDLQGSTTDGVNMELAKMNQYKQEIEAIQSVFQRFSRQLLVGKNYLEVASLGLHVDDDRLCINTTDARQVKFRYLPAGYYRLFGMVLDIAYRSYILSEGRTCDSNGLVIIDEVDLHLHPELEKVVLARLAETFSHMQLIVSTHSPLVLSGLNTSIGENRVLHLSLDKNRPILCPDVYGLDYNSVVQEIMAVGASDPELQRMIDRCAYLYSCGYQAEGDALKAEINDLHQLTDKEVQRRIMASIEELK